MKFIRWILVLVVLFSMNSFLLSQSAPNIENGFKAFGSYHGGELDTVNLQTGNLIFHVPVFSYPQRGGKLSVNYLVQGSSKNWQVGTWTDSQHIDHYRWILKESPGVYSMNSSGVSFIDPGLFELHRSRHLATDLAGNQTYTVDDYAIATGDGGWHWLSGSTASGHLMTMDGSGIQVIVTRGIKPDLSDDTATVIFRDGTQYFLPNISVAMPAPGQGNNVSGRFFQPELILDAFGTTQTAFDAAPAGSAIDADGNILSLSTDTLGRNIGGTVSATSDYLNCVTTRTITSATIFNALGPDGHSSTLKICMTDFIPSAAFSQPNVDPPSSAVPAYQLNSFAQGHGSYIGSVVMPDQNHWSFDYDDFGNVTKITLPTGGNISYLWTEISDGCADGSLTRVSRAISTRTTNDNNGNSYQWSYTWGALQQDGTLTNYVLDPNGNETAHVFHSVTTSPCDFYEVETRSYQGTHASGTLLHTVDTHYNANFGFTASSSFAADVVPDIITTTLQNGQMSKVVRQYDSGNGNLTNLGKVTDEKVYDYSGALLKETATTYEWQVNSAYLDAGLLDLPATVVVKDGAGCALAETDYTYDEANYLTAYMGTLPAGTHQAAPAGTVRGNLTTVTKWLAPTSSCNPLSGTAVSSHTKWYDTGVPYQTIDPLGHTTTLSYDSAYAGAYVTQTCSPQTGTVTHCVSGTYDFVTGLLESLTNENATTQASGNTPGDSAHTSSFAYDTSWRLISAQAPPDPSNANASATTTFTPSAANAFPLSVQRSKSITTGVSDLATTTFDGLAQPFKTQHAVPGNIATVLTAYDGLGQTTSVTNPYFTTSDPTYGVTQMLYDGLGRVYQTTRQDGSISSVNYNQPPCTTIADEAGKQRRTCTDALGRLIEVDEPGDTFSGTPGTGSLTISGTLASQSGVGEVGAAYATGQVTITGTDHATVTPGHQQCLPPPGGCSFIPSFTTYDSGTITLTVSGTPYSTIFVSSTNSSALSLAQAIANKMTSDPNVTVLSVTSGTNTASINLQARNAGTAGNAITLSTSASSAQGSFTITPASGNLSGGTATNPGITVYDQGNVSATVSGFTATVPYSQTGNSTAAQVASALATALSASSSPVTATSSGGQITLTYKSVGTSGDTSISVTSQSTQTQWTFPANAFTGSGTLSGGFNPEGISLDFNYFVTQYSYDGLGNLLQVTQKGDTSVTNSNPSQWRVRNFTYDSLGRLLTATNPESGTISYSYDADSELLQKTSPAPNQGGTMDLGTATQTVSFCYDELHRVTHKGYGAQSCPLATSVVTYTYDSAPNAKGKLISLTDQAGTANYGYDILGRLTTETRTLTGANNAAISKNLAYSYNLDGSLKTLTYPSGATVTYAPWQNGGVGVSVAGSAIDSGNGINYVTGASGPGTYATYGPDLSLTGFVSGYSGTFAGITNAFAYNKRLQPLTMSATAPSQTIYSIGYDFHVGNGTSGADNGNVFGITNYKDTSGSRNQTFTYDSLNRLTSAQNAGTDCTAMVLQNKTEYWGNSYSYDAWGNLLQKTITKCGAENLNVTADTHNWIHATALPDYQYDAAGNMAYDATASLSYSFDQENRLTGASGYTYTYDGDGNRVRKSNGNLAANGTLYWAMTPGVVAETDLAGTTKSEYIFFGGERVARRDGATGTGGVFYYFSDHLKTASVITDSAGVIKAESDYYPWGGELQFTNNDSNHYKFTGKERDETGLDYFGARYYSNGLGRFITPDWAAKATAVPYAEFADPQSLNLYTYVRNIPTTRFDLDGHCPDVCPIDGPKSLAELDQQNNAFDTAVKTFLDFLPQKSGPAIGPDGLLLPRCSCATPNNQNTNKQQNNNNNSKSENAAGEQGGSKDTRTAQDPLRKDANGKAIPDPEAQGADHSQLGTKTSNSQAGNPQYKQAMEYDANGNPVRRVDFSNHGRSDHPNPHEHPIDPNTGKIGPPQPLPPTPKIPEHQ
jgi:RHS repeat-associated protein